VNTLCCSLIAQVSLEPPVIAAGRRHSFGRSNLIHSESEAYGATLYRMSLLHIRSAVTNDQEVSE